MPQQQPSIDSLDAVTIFRAHYTTHFLWHVPGAIDEHTDWWVRWGKLHIQHEDGSVTTYEPVYGPREQDFKSPDEVENPEVVSNAELAQQTDTSRSIRDFGLRARDPM